MILTDLSPLVNHLWQSTVCAVVVWLLTLALKNNSAAVRFRLWLAASVKFLIPFSLFVSLGSRLGWRTVPTVVQAHWPLVIDEMSRTFAAPVTLPHAIQPAAWNPVPALLAGVWLCGFAASIIYWFRCWQWTREARRRSTPLALHLPIPAMSSPASVEPGVLGIRDPVLLLPAGIAERLTPAQLQAVLAHEMCHVRRRDNLTGAIQLLVEAVFWFHPAVWWIRVRLVEERERACDEAVLQSGSEREVYAEGILNVCKFYVESRVLCVSGITGSNLKKRIAEIMDAREASRLDWRRRLVLATAGAVAIAGPLAIGMVNAPRVRAQSQPTAARAFEVASVKANKSGDTQRSPSMILPGGRFTATNNTVRALILNAYGIFATPSLLEGGPGWIDTARYDIDAKAADNAIPAGTSNRVLWEKTRLMLRTLLADRFKLSLRRETKEMPVYQLVAAKNGGKLQKSDADCSASLTACHGFSGNPRRFVGSAVDMYDLALVLSGYSDRPVLDGTGIQGLFDIKLQWNPFSEGRQPADDAPRTASAGGKEGPFPDLSSLPTLFDALEQQLGLKLESRKGPVDLWVIDHVERPSEN